MSTTPELIIPVACTILYNVEVPSCYTTDQGSSSRKCYFALMQNSCRLAYREHWRCGPAQSNAIVILAGDMDFKQTI